MKRKKLLALNLLFLIGFLFLLGCDDSSEDLSPYQTLNEEVDSIAERYVKVGAMVGIINKQHKKLIFSYGTKTINLDEPPDSNTTFDIGSITKTFTAILASNMYLKGFLPNDTVGHYLPANVIMPTKDGVEITLTHILSHSSGLPRTPNEEGSTFPLPPNYDVENPYAEYTTEQIYDYLTNYCTLKFTPGTWWEYSNTGFGLIGHIVGLVDGTSYETVLTRDIFDVLGMDHSSLFLTNTQKLNQASGHDTYNKIVPFFTANDIFQGCGMIKSTLNDMFKYLEANMGITETPLRDAMNLTYQTIMHQGSMGDQGMAWFILDLDDGQKIIYMAGNTNGHSAYIAFNQKESTGAIILFNSSNHDGTNIEMGMEIMKAIVKY